MHASTEPTDSGPPPVTRPRARRAGLAGSAMACAAALIVAPGAGAAFAATDQPSPAATPLPSWAAHATKTGPLAAGSVLNLSVVLNGHDEDGAEAEALAVSSPSSRSYGHFLSPAAYRAKYAPTDAEVAAVTSWLKDAGFRVTSVPENHLWVRVSGTPAAAEKAFGTSLDAYRFEGRTLHAPSGAITIPSAVEPYVAGVAGLSSTTRTNRPQTDTGSGDRGDLAQTLLHGLTSSARRAVSPGATRSAPPAPAFVNAPPCSAYWGQMSAVTTPPAFGAVQPYALCGYTGTQLRGAYGVDKLKVTGAGVTVAVVDAYASPTILSDADTHARKHGGKPFARGQFQQITAPTFQYGYNDPINGDVCGEQGWYGEETLDIEAVHAVAPGAKVLYGGAGSCQDNDLLDMLNTIVDGHKADIVTNSWGAVGEPDPAADDILLQTYQRLFLQAATTGIGVFFSSGDNGDEVTHSGNRTVDFPSSSPWVTAVGGTSLGVGSRKNYLFEAAWGTGRSVLESKAWNPAPPGAYQYGGGGGTSRLFAQPWYQKGVVPASISQYFGGDPGRAVPDIAAIGDPNTGFLVGQTQTFPDGSVKYNEYRIGGTSLASPVVAAIEALADQAAGSPHGFANPAIYALNGSRALHDVQPLRALRGVVRVDYTNSLNASGGTSVTLRSFQQLGTLHVAKGYDDTTGVGTPNGYLYVYGLGQSNGRAVSAAAGRAG